MRHFAANRSALALTAAAAMLLSACADMTPQQRGTAQGAGIGAAAGGLLGAALGNHNTAAVGAVVGGVAGAVGGNLWSKRMEEKRLALEQQTQGTGVEVSRTADNQLKLNVPSDISFDVNQAVIKPQLRSVLDNFASGLNQDQTLRVRVVGHTDNTGSDAINDPLSERRAASVRNYLEDRGVAGSRIEIAGRGSHEPVADYATDSGRARNRRVEIFLREPQPS
jgi:outer membrane protein OmpA-like peptidoglycan-associated protein